MAPVEKSKKTVIKNSNIRQQHTANKLVNSLEGGKVVKVKSSAEGEGKPDNNN